MTRPCPNKQKMCNNQQGGQTMTPSHPTQSTSHMCAAVINKDEDVLQLLGAIVQSELHVSWLLLKT
jgi:hypothetical protein